MAKRGVWTWGGRVGVAAVLVAAPARALTYGASTVAGNGPASATDALGAAIVYPMGIATDSAGNVYVVAKHNRVYKVAGNAISVLAGDGSQHNMSGDGGPAAAATFNVPHGVAVDATGNVYIADNENHRVRRVDAVTGVITTVAGSGANDDSGDGGQAASAGVGYPRAMAFDAQGHLYIAQRNRVRRVDRVSGVITTVAGTFASGSTGDGGPATAARFFAPSGLAFDGGGNLLIADTANNRVRARLASNGTIVTLAGTGTAGASGDGGPATSATLSAPTGLAVDARGIWIADRGNHRVRLVSPQGVITTIAGSTAGFDGDGGPAAAAHLYSPWGLALAPDGAVLVSDTYNHRLRRIAPGTPTITTTAGRGDFGTGAAASAATLPSQPTQAAIDPANNLWFSTFHHEVFRVDYLRGTITQESCGGPTRISALAFTLDGDLLCADLDTHNVWRVSRTTGLRTRFAGTGAVGFSGDGGPAPQAALNQPAGLTVDKEGTVFIADFGNCRVRRVPTSGVIDTYAGGGGCTFAGDGGPATSAGFRPSALAQSGAYVYIMDAFDARVRAVQRAGGTIFTFAGNGTSGSSGDNGPPTQAQIVPTNIAADTFGNLYISEQTTGKVRGVSANLQRIFTLAGGTPGFAGDEQAASQARFRQPYGLAVDRYQRLYVTDFANNRVRTVFTRTAKGDFNSDGATDLVFQNAGLGTSLAWLMNGAARLSSTGIIGLPAGLPIVGVDDVNGDGQADIFLLGADNVPTVQIMEGAVANGAARPVTGTPALGTSWIVEATADFDRNGSPDILWRNTSTLALAIWSLNGTAYRSTLTPSPAQNQDANWRVVGATDLNGDTFVDLLWYNVSSGRLVYWLLDKSQQRTFGQFTNPMSAGDANWKPVAVGDFGTGPMGMPDTRDIVWRNDTSGRLVVWRMDRAGNRTSGTFTTPDAAAAGYVVVGPR